MNLVENKEIDLLSSTIPSEMKVKRAQNNYKLY